MADHSRSRRCADGSRANAIVVGGGLSTACDARSEARAARNTSRTQGAPVERPTVQRPPRAFCVDDVHGCRCRSRMTLPFRSRSGGLPHAASDPCPRAEDPDVRQRLARLCEEGGRQRAIPRARPNGAGTCARRARRSQRELTPGRSSALQLRVCGRVMTSGAPGRTHSARRR